MDVRYYNWNLGKCMYLNGTFVQIKLKNALAYIIKGEAIKCCNSFSTHWRYLQS